MMNESHCPDVPSLERFLLGKSSGEEATTLEHHLQDCERCLAVLQTVKMNDSMVDALQAGSSTGDVTANEGLQLLADWLKKLRPLDDANAPLTPSANLAELGDTEAYAKSADADSTVSYEFLAPGQDPSELGRLGPYRVRKVLGAGGMGVVFEAYDPDLDRLVALKTMLPCG